MLTYSLEYIWYNIMYNPIWQTRIKWAANGFIMIAAAALALSVNWRMSAIPYMSFMVGHILWGTMGIIMKDKPLIWLNWGFIPLDINAIAIST